MPTTFPALQPTPTETITPWSPIGYLVYKRTYSRDTSKTTSEEWCDTVERVLEGCRTQLNCGFSSQEEQRLRDYHLQLKGTVAGRFLWQLGTSTVDKLGLASLQNCAFTVVDRPSAFTWTFDLLMLGAGVGYNIQREHVEKLPPISERFTPPQRRDTNSANFIVPDTREGWVMLLHAVLTAAFFPERELYTRTGFSYSTHLVRGAGEPIKSFGGIASGPEELCRGIGEISRILYERRGQKLRPIDCLDIMNLIGQIVVSGNVRRSAQIAIGDCDDLDFLRAKRWDLANIPNWRAMSNNSVVCKDVADLPEEFWEGYKGNGEPYGLINLELARSCGRLGDFRYPDPGVAGFNPCAEQPLEDRETCCLAEIFLSNVGSFDELKDIATLLYRVCKHSLALSFHGEATEAVVHANRRMGIGITGYLQATEEQRKWLADVYESLRAFDVEYSRARGWPESRKLTTCKPSGTLSLLPGVAPGAHPCFAHHLIRRIRVSSNNPLVAVCRAHGYHTEFQRNFDGTEDFSTLVIEFPMRYPEHVPTASSMTALEQLAVVERINTEWSDNAVSCTVYYTDEELPQIQQHLREVYSTKYKSLSFLRKENHGFLQAPLEEITKAQYNALVAKTRPITSASVVDYDGSDECQSGACPVR